MSDIDELELKTCTKCGVPQSEDSFPWANKSKGYRNSKCKNCKSQYDKDNRDRIYNYQRQWNANNPDKVKEISKRTRTKRKRRILDYQNEYWKNRKKNDSSWKLRRNVSCCIKEALKRNHSQKNGSILQHLPYSFQELKTHLEQRFESWMTWDNHGRYDAATWDDNDNSTWTWHVDHIIPQADLPYTSMTDENFFKCWALSNLRPFSAKQNQADGGSRIRHKTK